MARLADLIFSARLWRDEDLQQAYAEQDRQQPVAQRQRPLSLNRNPRVTIPFLPNFVNSD